MVRHLAEDLGLDVETFAPAAELGTTGSRQLRVRVRFVLVGKN